MTEAELDLEMVRTCAAKMGVTLVEFGAASKPEFRFRIGTEGGECYWPLRWRYQTFDLIEHLNISVSKCGRSCTAEGLPGWTASIDTFFVQDQDLKRAIVICAAISP